MTALSVRHRRHASSRFWSLPVGSLETEADDRHERRRRPRQLRDERGLGLELPLMLLPPLREHGYDQCGDQRADQQEQQRMVEGAPQQHERRTRPHERHGSRYRLVDHSPRIGPMRTRNITTRRSVGLDSCVEPSVRVRLVFNTTLRVVARWTGSHAAHKKEGLGYASRLELDSLWLTRSLRACAREEPSATGRVSKDRGSVEFRVFRT